MYRTDRRCSRWVPLTRCADGESDAHGPVRTREAPAAAPPRQQTGDESPPQRLGPLRARATAPRRAAPRATAATAAIAARERLENERAHLRLLLLRRLLRAALRLLLLLSMLRLLGLPRGEPRGGGGGGGARRLTRRLLLRLRAARLRRRAHAGAGGTTSRRHDVPAAQHLVERHRIRRRVRQPSWQARLRSLGARLVLAGGHTACRKSRRATPRQAR